MRIPAAITAASLTLAPATPVEPVGQLLDDVSATHESSITAINSAETDDEVRDVLIAWRKELIAASDELAELRKRRRENSGSSGGSIGAAIVDPSANVRPEVDPGLAPQTPKPVRD